MVGQILLFWIQPRRTLKTIANGSLAGTFGIIGAYVFLRILIGSPRIYSWIVLAPHAPESSFRKFYRYLWEQCRNDILILLGMSAALWLFSRLVTKKKMEIAAAVNVIAFCALPLLLFIAGSGTLMFWGFDFWWGAHHPTDELRVLLVDRRVSLVRFAIKCVLCYGPPAIFLLDFVWHSFKERTAETDSHTKASLDPPKEGALWAVKMISMAAALIFTVSAVIHLDQQKARFEPVVPGALMPDSQLPRLTADPDQKKKDVRLADFRGKIVLIDFWATWCPPCMRALPQLEHLYLKYKDKNVVFIGINREPHQRRRALTTVKSLGLSFPQATDRRTGTPAGYGEKVGVQSLPTSMLLDPDGQVVKIHIGYTDPEIIEAELQALLDKAR